MANAEPSNITIAIVEPVSRRDQLKGLFLELRAIPVLLWSFTAITLGTAIGATEAGRLDAWLFLEALLLGVLIQGYETHAVNEIYDWRSGTDSDPTPRILSGGSGVFLARLLTERQLWAIFAVSSTLIGILAFDLASRTGPTVLVLAAIGYFAGLAYTLPPVATAYRPFVGEWLGGFAGVTSAGLGGAFVQSLDLSPLAIAVAVSHAFICVGMLLMHHYLDVRPDQRARPVKRTTIVFLGPRRGKAYAASFALMALLISGTVATIVQIEAIAFAAPAGIGFIAHLRTNPRDVGSVTRNEIVVIQAGVAGGLTFAGLLQPVLLVMVPLAVVLYVAHLRLAVPRRPPQTQEPRAAENL
jgi:1,4-dihydroxy-2-naphthoate octaprenyltransferase